MPSALLVNAITYGAVLSLILGVLILGSLRLDPTMWAASYPPDIKARFGPIPSRARRRRALLATIVYACIGVVFWLAIRKLPLLPGGALTFAQIFLTVWVVSNLFNLVDWLILDWFILVTLKPRWAVLPGTDETMAGYHNYAHHFRGFLIGLGVTTILSLIVTGMALLIVQLTS